jgi:hypothetical protein
MSDLCGCLKCQGDRRIERMANGTDDIFSMPEGFRYACETCGNKRCPHHSDHALECTASNEPGQPAACLWG